MIRNTIVVALMTILVFANGAFAREEHKNYQLTIDGKTYDLNLNEEIQVMGKSGKRLTIELRAKPYKEYSDQFVSFQHKSGFSVSSQDLGSGIQQLMLATATGTLIMIQEYSGVEPSSLVAMMLKELTKESVQYGHKMTQETVTRKLKSGVTLKGLKATLKYKGAVSYWEVLAYGKKDTGVLVMTHIDKAYIKTDMEVHSRFWNTLKLKF